MEPIRSLFFIVNASKPGARELAAQLIQQADAVGVRTEAFDGYPVPEDTLKGFDACCVIGGDGTMLGTVPAAINANVPVLGINLGKLGFMTAFTAEQAVRRLAEILEGGYSLRRREMLTCTDGEGVSGRALNDVVIRNLSSRMLRLSVYEGNQFLNEHFGDGLIFSTSTGSTAYNLSAGGPIIHPGARVMVMTPICPHTLSNRSLVLHEESSFRIEMHDKNHKLCVNIDGQNLFKEPVVFPLYIKRATEALHLIAPKGISYYEVLRSKLGWGDDRRKL